MRPRLPRVVHTLSDEQEVYSVVVARAWPWAAPVAGHCFAPRSVYVRMPEWRIIGTLCLRGRCGRVLFRHCAMAQCRTVAAASVRAILPAVVSMFALLMAP